MSAEILAEYEARLPMHSSFTQTLRELVKTILDREGISYQDTYCAR